MAGKRLAYSVYLDDPGGRHVCLTPDDEVPAWAKDKIGEHAYEADGGPSGTADAEEAAPAPASRRSRARSK